MCMVCSFVWEKRNNSFQSIKTSNITDRFIDIKTKNEEQKALQIQRDITTKCGTETGRRKNLQQLNQLAIIKADEKPRGQRTPTSVPLFQAADNDERDEDDDNGNDRYNHNRSQESVWGYPLKRVRVWHQ